MTRVCPHCQSPISTVTRDGRTYARCARRACGSTAPTLSTPDDAINAFIAVQEAATAARIVGMRDGVEIAKANVTGYIETCGCGGDISPADLEWGNVDAELERRTR